jgi:hypothetical protein
MPRNNTNGRVGINTSTPRAPLDVVNSVAPNTALYYAYFRLDYINPVVSEGVANNYLPNESIIASNGILASEFNAFSDARIKDIIGVSNTAKDLQTINYIKITDYKFKDKVKYGDKTYKKLIAQEVEKFYPQVVSKHTDFIPNVYQVSSRVEKIPRGYLLSFTTNHNISKDAKKLQVLLSEGEGMQEVTIVAMPSDKQIIINTTALKSDKVFVYGEEVDDYRTVDYEGLTTLNISATQELSKLVTKQQAAIDLLNKRLVVMDAQNNRKIVIKNHGINKKYSLD